jgi:hypothetical protein
MLVFGAKDSGAAMINSKAAVMNWPSNLPLHRTAVAVSLLLNSQMQKKI